MAKQKKPTDLRVWTLVYTLVLFILACVCIFFIKSYPQYKFGLVLLTVGCFIIIVHIGIRWMMYQSFLEKLKKKQNENIIPRNCPDYWEKKSMKDGDFVCRNMFVSQYGGEKTFRFGTNKTPNQYKVSELNRMKNRDKCWKIKNDKISWVELNNKCEVSGYA